MCMPMSILGGESFVGACRAGLQKLRALGADGVPSISSARDSVSPRKALSQFPDDIRHALRHEQSRRPVQRNGDRLRQGSRGFLNMAVSSARGFIAAFRRAHALDESENVFNTLNGRLRTEFVRRGIAAVANALPPRGFADGNGSAGRDDRGNADKTDFGKMRIRRYHFELQREIFDGAIVTY